MDPATATAAGIEAWKVGGLAGVLALGFCCVIVAVWRSSAARETRMQAALDAETAACKAREAELAKRLTQVEASLIDELRASANRSMELTTRSLEVSSRATHAIENQTRVTERVLARLDRDA